MGTAIYKELVAHTEMMLRTQHNNMAMRWLSGERTATVSELLLTLILCVHVDET